MSTLIIPHINVLSKFSSNRQFTFCNVNDYFSSRTDKNLEQIQRSNEFCDQQPPVLSSQFIVSVGWLLIASLTVYVKWAPPSGGHTFQRITIISKILVESSQKEQLWQIIFKLVQYFCTVCLYSFHYISILCTCVICIILYYLWTSAVVARQNC